MLVGSSRVTIIPILHCNKTIVINNPYYHTPLSLLSYTIILTIIYHYPYYHTPLSLLSYTIILTIIHHYPYCHTPLSLLSYTVILNLLSYVSSNVLSVVVLLLVGTLLILFTIHLLFSSLCEYAVI